MGLPGKVFVNAALMYVIHTFERFSERRICGCVLPA